MPKFHLCQNVLKFLDYENLKQLILFRFDNVNCKLNLLSIVSF